MYVSPVMGLGMADKLPLVSKSWKVQKIKYNMYTYIWMSARPRSLCVYVGLAAYLCIYVEMSSVHLLLNILHKLYIIN